MPSLIHHTASRDNPPSAEEANGSTVVGANRLRQAMLAERCLEDRPAPARCRSSPPPASAEDSGCRRRRWSTDQCAVPSPLLNQPLKSAHQTRFDFVGVRQRLRVRLGARGASCAQSPARPASRSPRWCWLPATNGPADPAPAHASTCAGPSACAPGADPAPPARPRPPSGSGVAAAARFSSAKPSSSSTAGSGEARHSRSHGHMPKRETQLGHGLLIPLILKHKAKLLVHHTARFPGHALRFTRARHSPTVSAMLPVCSVRHAARSVPNTEPVPPAVQHVTSSQAAQAKTLHRQPF